MTRERDRMDEIGKQLRDHIGELMLRRMKEDVQTGLKGKSGHNQSVPVELSAEQVIAYDAIVASVQGEDPTAESTPANKNRQLAALWQLRQVSLHPDLLAGGSIGTASNSRDSRAILQRSGKLAWLLSKLDEIKPLGQKVLVFCVQKKLQEALARHLALIYGLKVPVINGDTKVGEDHNPETRLGLIKEFSEIEGFGICILSPIAAGAGLNIVAANHVVHLERHWNPAKEDQATDRAYRIGQSLPVTVYLPAARHPNSELRSFDEVLHSLIEKKRSLQGALGLVPPQSVTDSELIEAVFTHLCSPSRIARIDLPTALRLPWRLYEALVAVLYERAGARRVILTPGGSDHGCDVVVLGCGASSENVLIQCKATSRDELDSEFAVREVEGARPYYENALLGITFSKRCLHTTARRLSKRTLNAARICGVSVYDRSWLGTELGRTTVTLKDLLARDGSRERV